MPVIEVQVIRHAESLANVGGRSTSPGSIPLTPFGRDQALEVATWFDYPPDKVIVSKYARTLETATPLLLKFNIRPEVWPVHEWTYLCPDKYSGTTQAERRPFVEAYLNRLDPAYVDGPGAESFQEYIGRVRETLERLRTFPGRQVVFSHEHFMKALLWVTRGPRKGIDAEAFRDYLTYASEFKIKNLETIVIAP